MKCHILQDYNHIFILIKTSIDDTIATYSFSLYPHEHQPSGTFNFSRVDNFEMTIDYTDYKHYSDYYTDFNNTGGTIKTDLKSISGHLMISQDNLPFDWRYQLDNNTNIIFHIFALNYNILKIMVVKEDYNIIYKIKYQFYDSHLLLHHYNLIYL